MTVCPKCGRQDTVHKVSDLVSFGFRLAAGSAAAPAAGTAEQAGLSAPVDVESEKQLADRLYVADDLYLEIEKKEVTETIGTRNRANRGLSILLCALAGFLVVSQMDPGWAWLGLLVGMLLGGIFFNYIPNRMIKMIRTAAQLNRIKAQRRYAALYFCMQDDLVFLPEEGLDAPAEQIIELLYRQ